MPHGTDVTTEEQTAADKSPRVALQEMFEHHPAMTSTTGLLIKSHAGQTQQPQTGGTPRFTTTCASTIALFDNDAEPRIALRRNWRGQAALTSVGALMLLAGCAVVPKPRTAQAQPIEAAPQRLGWQPQAVADASLPSPAAAHQPSFQQIGMASWYGPGWHGRRTASGQVYNMYGLTAAHRFLPFGTHVRVTDPATGRNIVVTITDRIGTHRRIIDLSVGAARALGLMQRGIAMVRLTSE